MDAFEELVLHEAELLGVEEGRRDARSFYRGVCRSSRSLRSRVVARDPKLVQKMERFHLDSYDKYFELLFLDAIAHNIGGTQAEDLERFLQPATRAFLEGRVDGLIQELLLVMDNKSTVVPALVRPETPGL